MLDSGALPGPAVVLPPSEAVPRADVVLSHAAGWHRRVTAGSHSYDIFDEHISRAIRESGARLAFSGHHHRWLAGRTDGGRTRCYGLGNRPEAWAVLDTRMRRVSRPTDPADPASGDRRVDVTSGRSGPFHGMGGAPPFAPDAIRLMR